MKINIITINLLLICSAKCFIFSVIIPIYNTARYLNDSIGSLLNQSIGYKNIQIILINDGSSDNSENICLYYMKLFEHNIMYIKIYHGGVSKSRNEGLKYAKGTLINFLDADDKWDSQAFENIYLFFKTYKDVDIVAGRIKNFELNNYYQDIDYKFKKTRLVNLTNDFNFIQLSAASCFFRNSSIIHIRFDEEVIFSEDVKFINTILLDKPLLGVVREAIYNCRKRADSSSASQKIFENKNYYFKTIYSVLQYLIDKSINLHNKILPFIQF